MSPRTVITRGAPVIKPAAAPAIAGAPAATKPLITQAAPGSARPPAGAPAAAQAAGAPDNRPVMGLAYIDWNKAAEDGGKGNSPFISVVAKGQEAANEGKMAQYHVRLKECRTGRTKPPKNQEYYATDWEVIASGEPMLHPIGSNMTWMVMLHHSSAGRNLLKFAVDASGWDISEIIAPGAMIPDPTAPGDSFSQTPPGYRRAPGTLMEFCGEGSPVAGVEMVLTATIVKMNNGGFFTEVKTQPHVTLKMLDEAAAGAAPVGVQGA